MTELVQRLLRVQQRIELGLRPEKSIEVLRECIGRGLVHVKFLDTRGPTEVGIRLEPTGMEGITGRADESGASIRLIGSFRLDSVQIRCIAEVDLHTMMGTASLEGSDETAAS